MTPMREVQVTTKIQAPRPPNFIQTADGRWLPLCAFSKEGLEQIVAAFRDALLQRAAEQSKDPEFFYKNASKGESNNG